MKIFKTAVKAILVFDAAYLCFVCAEDVCSRIRSRMKKKNKTEPEPHFLDDEEEDTKYKLLLYTNIFPISAISKYELHSEVLCLQFGLLHK